VYIRAFQQASDLDDAVEEKLLIGDRPKPSPDPEFRVHWKERLVRRNPGDLDDVGKFKNTEE
jgi:N-terminal acetyltransferase B complex non-catalytic subunit